MRSHKTLIPFITLALTLAADAVPTPHLGGGNDEEVLSAARGALAARTMVITPAFSNSHTSPHSIPRKPVPGSNHGTSSGLPPPAVKALPLTPRPNDHSRAESTASSTSSGSSILTPKSPTPSTKDTTGHQSLPRPGSILKQNPGPPPKVPLPTIPEKSPTAQHHESAQSKLPPSPGPPPKAPLPAPPIPQRNEHRPRPLQPLAVHHPRPESPTVPNTPPIADHSRSTSNGSTGTTSSINFSRPLPQKPQSLTVVTENEKKEAEPTGKQDTVQTNANKTSFLKTKTGKATVAAAALTLAGASFAVGDTVGRNEEKADETQSQSGNTGSAEASTNQTSQDTEDNGQPAPPSKRDEIRSMYRRRIPPWESDELD